MRIKNRLKGIYTKNKLLRDGEMDQAIFQINVAEQCWTSFASGEYTEENFNNRKSFHSVTSLLI